MLRSVIALWKGHSFMKRVVEEFGEMLSDAEFVFTNAWEVLVARAALEAVRQPLYDRDIAVNKRERQIRRSVLEHLSVNPGQDVSGCLAMMSLVKDAERIGDYAKNIFDLAVIMSETPGKMQHLDELSRIQSGIAGRLLRLKSAFVESDEEVAQEILKGYASLKENCNAVLQSVFSEDLPGREAVATALISRYLKRINSHVSNIASGIIYPLDQIDFVRGDLLE